MAVFLSRSLPCGGEGSVRAWAETQCQPAPPGVPRAVAGGGHRKHPLSRSPRFPVHVGRRAHAAAQPNCKIKFPRCSGPRSSCVLSGEEMGIGESCAIALPARPALPVPPSTAGAVNHAGQRPPWDPTATLVLRGLGRGLWAGTPLGGGVASLPHGPESPSRVGRGTGAA